MSTTYRRLASYLTVLALAAPVAAFGQISVVSSLFNAQPARPGETYDGIIRVQNESAEPQEVRVYQTDYLFYADGTNIYGDPASHPRSNAGWISFSPDFLIVPPNGVTNVTYSVTVPQDTLSGTYWSMIMVEGIPKGSPESTRGASDLPTQVGIRTTIRFGVQVATGIPGPADREVAFASPKLEATEDGGKVLKVDVVNEGSLLFQPKIWMELYDAQGHATARIEGANVRLYPGTSTRQQFPLSSIEAGQYQALVFVDAGDGDVFGAQYTLDL